MASPILSALFRVAHRGLRVGPCHLFNFAWHAEHAGPGRIASFRFLGGAGYVWRPYGKLRGFDVNLRLRRGRPGRYRIRPAPPLFWITRNPQRYASH